MAILLASILDCDWENLEEEVRAVDNIGVDGFSIDVMDGHFVPRITFGPHTVSKVRNITDLPIEVHLMIIKPEEQVEMFCDAGADQLIFQIETTPDPLSIIDYIHSRGLQAGLSILVETDLSCLTEEILGSIDALNFLAVPVGYGGQKPSPATFDRIATIREKAKSLNHNLALEVDGGIKPDNCGDYVKAGADVVTIGTGIYKAENYESAICFAKGNISYDDVVSRKRVERFLGKPSYALADDIERRKRLDRVRKELDIPVNLWDPLNSKR